MAKTETKRVYCVGCKIWHTLLVEAVVCPKCGQNLVREVPHKASRLEAINVATGA